MNNIYCNNVLETNYIMKFFSHTFDRKAPLRYIAIFSILRVKVFYLSSLILMKLNSSLMSEASSRFCVNLFYV